MKYTIIHTKRGKHGLDVTIFNSLKYALKDYDKIPKEDTKVLIEGEPISHLNIESLCELTY